MKNCNSLFNLFIGSVIAISATSCDRDDNVKVITPKPDGAALLENFDSNIKELTQKFSVDAANGGLLVGKKGTRIRFSPNSFLTLEGKPVTGNVDIEFVEIYKKADMLFTKMSTNGKHPDGSIETLISGGEFYVNATQNGNQLKLATEFNIGAPVDNTGGFDEGMGLFDLKDNCAGTGADCNKAWVQNEKARVGLGKADGQGGVQSVYSAFQGQFGWTNIDRWYSDPRPKTTIFVDVPAGYDASNCAVYLSYDGETSALALFDTYDSTTELFSEHYGLIPIGLQVHFIMVSVVDGQWNYAIQPATITANHLETITALQPIDETDLKTLIDNLP